AAKIVIQAEESDRAASQEQRKNEITTCEELTPDARVDDQQRGERCEERDDDRDSTEARHGAEVNLPSRSCLVVPAELDGLVPNQEREHGSDHQRDKERDGVRDHAAGAESGMMGRATGSRGGRTIRVEKFQRS